MRWSRSVWTRRSRSTRWAVSGTAPTPGVTLRCRSPISARVGASRLRSWTGGQGRWLAAPASGTPRRTDRRIEIGWTWLAVGWQGRGFNTRAKYLLLERCFESLSAHRVEFKTDAINHRARQALRKVGATEEGTLRAHTLMHDGRYRDTVYYSILADEWERVRAHLRSLIEDG